MVNTIGPKIPTAASMPGTDLDSGTLLSLRLASAPAETFGITSCCLLIVSSLPVLSGVWVGKRVSQVHILLYCTPEDEATYRGLPYFLHLFVAFS